MIGPFGLKPKGTMSSRALPLAKALVRRGHQVAIFLPPWSNPEDAGRAWDDEGVRVDNIAINPRALIAPRLVNRALAWRADVIHFFKPKAYSGLAAWELWQLRHVGRTRARLVLDTDDWEGAGGWNELEKYSALHKKFFAWQEQWGLTHADAVTVASRALETIVWSLGQPRARVYYLANGATFFGRADATSRARIRAQHGWNEDPVVLLYTRFFEFSVERFAEIFARIVRLVPRARLLVVGKGLFDEEKKLESIAGQRGWGERVHYTGWLEPKMLPGYFAAADIALYPFDDTLVNRTKSALKLIDLLAAGVPVVADSVGQLREYITHNETGLLVQTRAVDEFARAASRLLRDADLRARLGACAAATITREYNWDMLAGIAEQAYSPSINPSPSS